MSYNRIAFSPKPSVTSLLLLLLLRGLSHRSLKQNTLLKKTWECESSLVAQEEQQSQRKEALHHFSQESRYSTLTRKLHMTNVST